MYLIKTSVIKENKVNVNEHRQLMRVDKLQDCNFHGSMDTTRKF